MPPGPASTATPQPGTLGALGHKHPMSVSGQNAPPRPTWEDQVNSLWSRCCLLFDGSWWHRHRSQLPHAADVLGRSLESPGGHLWVAPRGSCGGVWGPLEPPTQFSPLPAGTTQRTLPRVPRATAVTPAVPLLTPSVETCQVLGVGQGGPTLFWGLGRAPGPGMDSCTGCILP